MKVREDGEILFLFLGRLHCWIAVLVVKKMCKYVKLPPGKQVSGVDLKLGIFGKYEVRSWFALDW